MTNYDPPYLCITGSYITGSRDQVHLYLVHLVQRNPTPYLVHSSKLLTVTLMLYNTVYPLPVELCWLLTEREKERERERER